VTVPNKRDDYDLSNVDLDALDDSLVGYPRPRQSSFLGRLRRVVIFLLLVGAGIGVYWIPRSSFYANSPLGDTLFFGVCAGAIVFGFVVGRWLWIWAEESARRYALEHRPKVPRPEKPITATERWLTLLAALGGALAIVFGSPAGGYLVGGTYNAPWYVAAIGAIVVGMLVGRWIFIHANRPLTAPLPERRPIVLPPWLKWLNLVLLVAGALVAGFGGKLFGDYISEDARFAFGGLAFVVGVLLAIWVVRRFDEEEKRLSERTRGKR
jgi:hypothetical protein